MLIAQFVVPMLGSLLLMMSAHRMSIFAANFPQIHRAFFVTVGFIPLITQWWQIPLIVFSMLIASLALIFCRMDSLFARAPIDFSLEESLILLDQLILAMKSGRSLKAAMSDSVCAPGSSVRMSRLLHEFSAHLDHGGDFSKSRRLSRELLAEIRGIEARGSRMIAGLESCRSMFRTRFIFRRRSGQITLQTRLQSVVAGFLYAPLLIIQIHAGNAFVLRTIISAALFGAAQVWIHLSFRRFNWKV